MQSGDWLTLHWGHQLWFEKRPLLMWVTAAFYRVFGINEFCPRIVSALAGIFLAGLTCAIAAVLSLFLLAGAVELLPSNYRGGMAPVAILGRIVATSSPENREPLLVFDRPYGGTPGPTLMYYSNRPVEWPRHATTFPVSLRMANRDVPSSGEMP